MKPEAHTEMILFNWLKENGIYVNDKKPKWGQRFWRL